VSRTPDRFPGEREDEGLLLIPDTIVPLINGEMRYVTGVGFRFFDEGVEKGLTGTGISEAQHKTLRQLVHLAEEGGPYEGFTSGAYQETLPAANPFPTSIIWWTSAAKTDKIVEETITYNANKTIATDEWKVYDIDGSTVLATVTDTISYSSVFETSRTRAVT
jgi:hypothetical protein